MTAAVQDSDTLELLASTLGAPPDHAVDLSVGARRVRLLSNDPVVVAYAGAVLGPAAPPGPGARPPDAVCLAALVDPPALDRLDAPDGRSSGPVALHRGRTGRVEPAASGRFRIVGLPGRRDRFVTDATARTVLYAGVRDDPRAVREPVWLAEALLAAVAAQDGPVLAAAAVGSASGTALLLDDGSGTAGAVLPLLYGHAAELVAWSAVQLTAVEGEPDRILVRGLPGPCEVPAPWVRRSPALNGRTCLADHPSLALPGPGPGGEDADEHVAFTADELVRALGAARTGQAPLTLVTAPSGGSPGTVPGAAREAALRRAASVAAARYPAWHGIGPAPAAAGESVSGSVVAAFPWTTVPAYDGPAAERVGAGLRHHRLTEAVPDLPDARRWPRAPMTGTWVAVMEHRRLARGMRLERWQTRAVCAGAVHELMTTPAPPPPGSDRVDEVAYLGFAAFDAGLLCVGDAVREADGTLLGHVLGFDDTHLPNHMNVVLLSEDRRTGRRRGLTPGGGLHVVSPADVRPPEGGENS
ncbi:DUF6917 domain-containing protein [Streptomyces sp. NPDC018711]|uniref:DUF6917 domain-containing protein n=1 Tax=Streptomyces sp. NPDC018711 TaxID=3365052 RepID=UPI0037A782DB